MAKKTALHHDFLYPFCQHKPYAQFKIGAFTWQQRWAVINKHLKKKDTYENVSLYPVVDLLNEVKQTQKLPAPLYNRCLLLDQPISLLKNIAAIIAFDIAARNKKPIVAVPPQVNIQEPKNIYLEQGVVLKHCYMNTDNGPIYISKNAVIQEGVCLRGPLWIGENTIVKMGATIYGNTIIGNNCLVNGEIKNSILMDNSNKAHFGYLGDSIVANGAIWERVQAIVM
jgi:UDP-N-acetylglucosamine diphosphorylase / glucose-1-phosphate thymidylyltransferase / UDP-N-acetylgalactosamine diphosphorylase / glucosamine-1-phosphate N-acetyltransferase / galactosamine-1-phosphate N-acetyltransferase